MKLKITKPYSTLGTQVLATTKSKAGDTMLIRVADCISKSMAKKIVKLLNKKK